MPKGIGYDSIEVDYDKIIKNIEADCQHYDKYAKDRYNTANEDYNSERELSVTKNNKNIPLKLVNNDKELVKRFSALISGSKINVNVVPLNQQSELISENIKLYIQNFLENTGFERKTRKFTNFLKRIGISYIATSLDPKRYNKETGTLGVIRQEIVDYKEVRLDLNSRDAFDPESDRFRNREFRIRVLPLDELRRIAEDAGKDETFINSIRAYTSDNDSYDILKNIGTDGEEEHGILIEYEFRQIETVPVSDEDGADEVEMYKYYNCSIINNNKNLILQEVEPNHINEFIIDVCSGDEKDDTPYPSGYIEETKNERELEAEAFEAEIRSLKAAPKAKFIRTRMKQGKLNDLAKRMDDPTQMIALSPEDEFIPFAQHQYDQTYSIILDRISDVKHRKGGEFDLQAGEQKYSGTTGKAINLLNSRSDLAKEGDKTNVEFSLTNSLKKVLKYTSQLYNMPIEMVRRIGENNEFSELKPQEIEEASYRLNIKFDLNSDVAKAEKKEFAIANRDSLSIEDRFKAFDVPNVETLVDNFYKEQGIFEIAEWVNQNPENVQILKEIIGNIEEDRARAEEAEKQAG